MIPVFWGKQTRGKIKTEQCGPSVPEGCVNEANVCSINSIRMNITDELVKYKFIVLREKGVLEILRSK